MSSETDDQQMVLAEVSHDLANRFHRSYYFLDLLDDALVSDRDEAASLLARLRSTVEEVESMARSTLDFLRPMELRTLGIRLSDLTASLRQHVGMRTVEMRGDEAAGQRAVAVDPARISAVLATLCKAAVSENLETPVVVELIDGDPVSLRIHCASGTPKPSRTDLELALTARVASLHGGCLEIDDGEPSSLTLRLPVAERGN